MTIRRWINVCLFFMLGLAVIGLTQIFPTQAKAATTVSQLVTSNGKTYLQVDGKPWFNVGIQNAGVQQLIGDTSAFATPMPTSWLENLFEKTAAANFKTIQIILRWRDIEPSTQGTYNWSIVDNYVSWANTYGLRIDWVWFGSISSGGGTLLSGHANGFAEEVPNYVNNTTYFPYGDSGDQNYQPDVTGSNSDYLFSSEASAITALFNHLATTDTNHRSILFEVPNEPNLSRWVSLNYSAYLSRINQLAGAVKSSNYIVAVRTNFAGSSTDPGVNNLSNMDFTGIDPYTTSVSTIKNFITSGSSKMPYIAENGGQYDNESSLVATALVNGGFYDVWQLNDAWRYWLTPYYSDSVNYTTWTLGTIPPLNTGAQRLSRMLVGLNNIASAVTTAPAANMMGYNIENDTPSSSYSTFKTITGPGKDIAFYTTDGSIGMVVNSGNYFYCVSDTANNANVYFTTKENPISVTYGYLDGSGNWVSQGNVSVTNNGNGTWGMPYNAQQAIRIELSVSTGGTTDDSVTGTGTNQFNYTGSWTHQTASGYGFYNNTQSYSSTTNDYVQFQFTGTQITLYGNQNTDLGKIAVSIDGGSETTVDEYASTQAGNVSLWTSPTLSSGTHTLKVRVTGTKNASSSNYYAAIDRVVVNSPTTTVDDSVIGTGTNQFNYTGSWTHQSASGYGFYNNTQSYSNTTNDYVQFQFTGTQITFYGNQNTDLGKIAVSIDGGSETTVDEYASTQAGNVSLWTSPTLSSGTHTLKVRVTGTKNASSSNYYAAIDRVVVTP